MALIENKARHKAPKTVRLRSRDNQVVQVADERDRDFLELADEFIMNARAIQEDPSRRRPGLRFS